MSFASDYMGGPVLVGDGYEQAPEQPRPLAVGDLLEQVNLCDVIDDDGELGRIGQEVKRGYDIDEASRADWKLRIERATKLAMQIAEEKSFPWPGAANVKYPMLTTAAIQFNARSYPAIVQGRDVVKPQVTGADRDGQKIKRAQRIAEHMSYQLTTEMVEWEEDTDRLLVMLPIVGCLFRKTWFDPVEGRPMSMMVPPEDLVVNYKAKSLDSVPRISQVIRLYPNEVVERQRRGIYRDVALAKPQDGDDDDAPMTFIEQHCRLDLDDDGYSEPYIVTIHEESTTVVRIAPRFDREGVTMGRDGRVIAIAPVQYFTKYGFIPSPDGGFYDVGLGLLLDPINETSNAVINMLLDAGTLDNAGGGMIGKGLRIKERDSSTAPGVWLPVESDGSALKDNIVPWPHKGPSPVLFQLLGMLIEAGKDIASVKDVLTGEQQQSNVPATTTLALIEQGMKVFTAIYKRIHRSLKQEFAKLYRINRLYVSPQAYANVLDEPADPQADYRGGDCDVVPVSDPTIVTDMQRLGRAQFLMQFSGDPLIDQVEIRKRVLAAASIEDAEKLLKPPGPMPPPPDLVRAESDAKRVQIEAIEAMAKIALMRAQAVKALADAEATEVGSQIDVYMAQLEALTRAAEGASDDRTGPNGAVAEAGRDAGGAAVLQAPAPPADGEMGAGPSPAGFGPAGPMPGPMSGV
ncbi:co-chaperone GroES [Zavarzinia compransoris]|uniref:co-chaperone GroES n=1 Tax=Zavarzinia marina TaxID=2911065 RepID=UPI001F309716|nr:co-chaperone GroES [Zavarzinia marina]MCF4166344.1 co-chaperone GroES [Zavarzinia marina]